MNDSGWLDLLTISLKKILVLVVQFVIIFACYNFSVRLRYGFEIPTALETYLSYSNFLYTLLGLGLINIFGYHKGWFRYVVFLI
mgnify:CR=1 FL=1